MLLFDVRNDLTADVLQGIQEEADKTRAVTGIDSVIADERAAGKLVVEHLTSLGHEKIVHLAPPWRPSGRVSGYIEAMEAAGLDPQVEDAEYEFDDVKHVTRRLMKSDSPPTAIYANNDLAAFAVLDALAEENLRVPEDVAVVGFDNLGASELHSVSLTSIDQQPILQGKLAVRTALARALDKDKEPIREVLAPHLVVRRSTQQTVI